MNKLLGHLFFEQLLLVNFLNHLIGVICSHFQLSQKLTFIPMSLVLDFLQVFHERLRIFNLTLKDFHHFTMILICLWLELRLCYTKVLILQMIKAVLHFSLDLLLLFGFFILNLFWRLLHLDGCIFFFLCLQLLLFFLLDFPEVGHLIMVVTLFGDEPSFYDVLVKKFFGVLKLLQLFDGLGRFDQRSYIS